MEQDEGATVEEGDPTSTMPELPDCTVEQELLLTAGDVNPPCKHAQLHGDVASTAMEMWTFLRNTTAGLMLSFCFGLVLTLGLPAAEL